ncbi:hypothetical protein RDWZM_002073 [Blomia tropicalis]|uniref:SHSP domain-containing protein n=1 Tax=Blomia tropicalis TaxID=40697 RepID=A0A9Q0MEA6_BLOTA|nr:hypothetical protein RDWZM_002073 [Blomia tropicalis]
MSSSNVERSTTTTHHSSSCCHHIHPEKESYRELASLKPDRSNVTSTFYDTEITPKIEDGKFKIRLDFHGFEPSDIQVKMERDQLVIKGKKNGDPKNGVVQNREIVQQFNIPKNVNSSGLSCKLDSFGYLNVEAPLKQWEDERIRERYIPVYKSYTSY